MYFPAGNGDRYTGLVQRVGEEGTQQDVYKRQVLGLENNIYLQTGVIMLIGLLAKTAILITEYAIERRRKGMGIVESRLP